jgi:hypothetical protein
LNHHRLTLLSCLLASPFLGACFLQTLDSNASSQAGVDPNAGKGPTRAIDTPPIELDFEGKRTTKDPCDATREQAAEILTTYCAGCHGGRTTAEKHGDFNTILDTNALIAGFSSTVNDPENPGMKMRLLVPGNPEASRIYLRVSHGEMPPPAMLGLPPNPTPTISDISVLREWITNCAGPTTTPPPGPSTPPGDADGGAPPGETPPPPPPASPDGGAVDAGTPPASPDARPMADAATPPPMATCGLVGLACCPTANMGVACTAAKSRCGLNNRCEACGGANQVCCGGARATQCEPNFECGGVTRLGTCEPCGGNGQRCCGDGPFNTQTCNAGLTCRDGQIFRCGP